MATLVDMPVDKAEAVATADITVNIATISAVNKETAFLLTWSMISNSCRPTTFALNYPRVCLQGETRQICCQLTFCFKILKINFHNLL